MKDMMNFNPKKHYQNLEKLGSANYEIKKDIDKIKDKLNADLTELLDKFYYKKKYNELVEKNKLSNELESSQRSDKKLSPRDMKKNSSRDKKALFLREKTSHFQATKKNNKTHSKNKHNNIHHQILDPKLKQLKQIDLETYDIYQRCFNYLESGSPSVVDVKNYIDSVVKKFVIKSNKTKPIGKNYTKFQVKVDDPEFKSEFDTDNPRNVDSNIESNFNNLKLIQNSLIEILNKKWNHHPGNEHQSSKKNIINHHADINDIIEKSRLKVDQIIPKQNESNNNNVSENKDEISI